VEEISIPIFEEKEIEPKLFPEKFINQTLGIINQYSMISL